MIEKKSDKIMDKTRQHKTVHTPQKNKQKQTTNKPRKRNPNQTNNNSTPLISKYSTRKNPPIYWILSDGLLVQRSVVYNRSYVQKTQNKTKNWKRTIWYSRRVSVQATHNALYRISGVHHSEAEDHRHLHWERGGNRCVLGGGEGTMSTQYVLT